MSLKLEIEWPGAGLGAIAEELKGSLPEEFRDKVMLGVEPARLRSGTLALDPAIIGGIIQAAAMVLCPFLTVLLTMVHAHKGKSVVIILPDKTVHELSTNATVEQVNQVANAVEGAGSAQIKVMK